MVSLVFVIGAVNFALGFGLAVALEKPSRLSRSGLFSGLQTLQRFASGRKREAADRATGDAALPGEPTHPQDAAKHAPASGNDFTRLPSDWSEVLASREISVRSLAEAGWWVADSRLKECCSRLQGMEQQVHSDVPESLVQNWKQVAAACQKSFEQILATVSSPGESSPPSPLLAPLVTWCAQAMRVFESLGDGCETQVGEPNAPTDTTWLRQRLRSAYLQLCELAVQCQVTLGRHLADDGRIGELSPLAFRDPPSGCWNRIGREVLLWEWSEKDPEHLRMASVGLFDLDHCTQLNDRYGLAVTEQLLTAAAGVLNDSVRKDRGFDRVVRLTGPTVLVFLGDTAIRNAVQAVERLRQQLALTTFQTEKGAVTLTASVAVAEWGTGASFDELVAQLAAGMKDAKAGGRNCTVTCGGEGVRVLPPARFQLAAREIAVPAESGSR